ncbi:type IV pilin [Salinirussus salinus]|jgi:hypothetical protein|uniref:type IV pilin n=1 Tax=Salinirussus salinus TaxID=1198300 RepID=UPI001356C3CE|nr:type IV pilin [Salinirussus salinus]
MDGPSRRDVLRAGGVAGLAATSALSGCAGLFGDGGDGESTPDPDGTSRLDAVPEGATAVVHADLQSMFEDEVLRERVNRLVADLGQRIPQLTVTEALDLAEERSGLDPRRMNELLAFGSVATGDGALLVRTEFTDAEVTELVETSVDVTERTYGDHTVYGSGNGSQLAVLGDGRYVLGTPMAVERVVDVQNGDVQPVGGEVRTAYAAARGGYMRFGFDIPPERLSGSGGQAAAARDIEYGYGSLFRDGRSLLLSLTARTEDVESAEALRAQLGEGIEAVRADLDQIERPQLRSRVERLLTKTELSRDGPTVTVRNSEGGVAIATAVAAVVVSFVLGLGSRPVDAPEAVFGFDYDPAAEQLTVQHRGGDHIAAARLSAEGQGVGATGAWAALGGEASGTIGEQPAVQAGDSLVLGARPGYDLSLVWTAADGSTSRTLATDSGPEA